MEAGLVGDPPALEVQQAALGHLVLAQRQPQGALHDLERRLGGGEEQLTPRTPDPERPRHAAGKVQTAGQAIVEPRRRHGAAQLLERRAVGAAPVHERKDRLGIDRHPGLGALDPVALEDLLVVRDPTVVDADDCPVPDRMVVGEQGGVALRELAHVDERLGGVVWQLDAVEERRCPRPLLVDMHAAVSSAVRVSDGIGTTLGDPGEQGLRGQRPINRRGGVDAEAGNSTHQRVRSPRSDMAR